MPSCQFGTSAAVRLIGHPGRVTSLRRVGYWNGGHSPGWPDVTSFTDADWDEDERAVVSQYLCSGTMARTFMGYSACRLCGASNGYAEFTDGSYIWPAGLVHYVDEHGVRRPDEFVQHAVARLAELEGAEVDDQWWRSQHCI